jgi:hypothetical protein
LTRLAAERQADLHAHVDRERLARLASRQSGHRQPWAALSGLGALLAPLLMAIRHS